MTSYYRGTGFLEQADCESELVTPVVCEQCGTDWYLQCQDGYIPSSDCKRCVRQEPAKKKRVATIADALLLVFVVVVVFTIFWRVVMEGENLGPTVVATSVLGSTNTDAFSTLKNLSSDSGQKYYV